MFKGGADRPSNTRQSNVEGRLQALKALGHALAKKPYDGELVQIARMQVLRIGGPELVTEAGLTAAFFEVVAKFVDASRKRPFPSIMYTVMSYVLWLGQVLYDLLHTIKYLLPLKLKVET